MFSLAHDSTENAIGKSDGMYVDDRNLRSKVEWNGKQADMDFSLATRRQAHDTSIATFRHLEVLCGSVSSHCMILM